MIAGRIYKNILHMNMKWYFPPEMVSYAMIEFDEDLPFVSVPISWIDPHKKVRNNSSTDIPALSSEEEDLCEFFAALELGNKIVVRQIAFNKNRLDIELSVPWNEHLKSKTDEIIRCSVPHLFSKA